ncbi:MAG: hypothetical protein D6678_07335 [Zetaproteobacteria bacterium]|nr:MAG: hypothetical protein D6678_07335 [Zetaproteobacteria bacterium]
MAIILLLFALTACAAADQSEEAQKIVQQLHQDMINQDWQHAIGLYDKDFLAEHPPQLWQAKLSGLTKRFGKLTKVVPVFMQKDPRLRGDFYMYGFRLEFARGRVEETLTVFKGVRSDRMVISGHVFKHKGKIL